MILYLDASALVKRYVAERGSKEVNGLIAAADVVATSLISRAEVAAAFARAVRLGVLEHDGGRRAQRRFSREWPDIARVPVSEALVSRAETLAWDYGLRGYDAVQLASGLTWQESIGQEVLLGTFDGQLWEAAPGAGLRVWPEKLAK
ncbi:MAG TPA: type II toxin-antitoxin system VapC family toxin [Thermoanaerobaculia bacterium]